MKISFTKKGLWAFLMVFTMMSSVSLAAMTGRGEEGEVPYLGSVMGDSIDLKLHDHTIAGSVRDFVIWGHVDEATFTSHLLMRRHGQMVSAEFKKGSSGKIEGRLAHSFEGVDYQTELRFKGFTPDRKLVIEVNGREAVIALVPESMAGDHLVNPAMIMTYEGRTYEWKVTGSGCYGFLIHFSLLMTGALLH